MGMLVRAESFVTVELGDNGESIANDGKSCSRNQTQRLATGQYFRGQCNRVAFGVNYRGMNDVM